MRHGEGVQGGRDAQHAELVRAGLLRPHPALPLHILTLLPAGWELDVPPGARTSAENAQRTAHPAQAHQVHALQQAADVEEGLLGQAQQRRALKHGIVVGSYRGTNCGHV